MSADVPYADSFTTDNLLIAKSTNGGASCNIRIACRVNFTKTAWGFGGTISFYFLIYFLLYIRLHFLFVFLFFNLYYIYLIAALFLTYAIGIIEKSAIQGSKDFFAAWIVAVRQKIDKEFTKPRIVSRTVPLLLPFTPYLLPLGFSSS